VRPDRFKYYGVTRVTCGCDLKPIDVPRTGVTPYPGATSSIAIGGRSVIALYGPMVGGAIQNPATTAEQGIAPLVAGAPIVRTRRIGAIDTYPPGFRVPIGVTRVVSTSYDVVNYGPPELLYVSLVGPAALEEGGTTRVLFPGQTLSIPANWQGSVWVNAATNGHRFAATVVQPVTPYPPIPYSGSFPPDEPTSKTTTIPSYLYQQYTDDDDLQAFVMAQNAQTQAYVDWFNTLNLPIYTKQIGRLLDWVGEGLYGVARPTLYSGRYRSVGALDTFTPNQIVINSFKRIGQFTNIAATSDDVYKRIITWHVYKGDGKQVSVRWLKRRIARFLFGAGGADYSGSTDQISVVLAAGAISITILTGRRSILGGAILNRMPFNTTAPDELRTEVTSPIAVPALAAIFKEAIDTGALQLPQQYTVTCRIGLLGGRPEHLVDVLPISPLAPLGFSTALMLALEII
jgi:hypothetical protein